MEKLAFNRISLSAFVALLLTVTLGGVVWAAPCLFPTEDCPQVDCD